MVSIINSINDEIKGLITSIKNKLMRFMGSPILIKVHSFIIL